MASAILTIEGLTKRYKGVTAVDNINASMYGGEIIGLVGPTGSGKSTLVNLIGGLVMPDSGDILINGISMYRDFEKCMMFTGVVPDRPSFYRGHTGRKNLSFIASMYKKVGSSVIDRLAGELELTKFIDQPVEKYSAGVIARLAIAAALLHSPGLLVMDGVLASLDPVSVISIRKLLRRLAAENGVCIVVTAGHMTDVERVCDKVGIMDHGQLLGISPIDVIRKANCNKSRHRMLLDRPEEAAVYLNETDGVGVDIHENYIIVEADQGRIPRYLSMLAARGFLVFEVAPVETTLENAYVRMLMKNPAKTVNGGGNTYA